jgi:hypothetical protein
MKGTQLWQGIGSPLIEGRSRRPRPFWRPWLGALIVSAVCVGLVAWALYGVRGSDVFVVASAVGSGVGVGIARRLEWRSTWMLGVLTGTAVACGYLIAAERFWPVALVAMR